MSHARTSFNPTWWFGRTGPRRCLALHLIGDQVFILYSLIRARLLHVADQD